MSLARSEWLYRRLLWVLPKSFRSESEAELLALFRHAYTRRTSRLRFWLMIVSDLMVTSMAERVKPRASALKGERRSYWNGLRLDVTAALRRIVREPTHALGSAAVLSVGLAASVLVLTLVRGVLLAPLPFPQSEQLVRLFERDSTGGRWYPSFPNITDWRDNARVFSSVGAADVPNVRSVLLGGGAMRARIGQASRDFFATLGVQPALGRAFTASENAPGGAPVALVSWEFYQGELGGRPLSGLALTIGEHTYSVVGVLPAGFRFLGDQGTWADAPVWLPMEQEDLGGRESHGFHTIARLRPGVTLEAARREMNRLAIDLKQRHREPTQADAVIVNSLFDEVVGKTRQPLRLLLVAAAFVLLVTSLNLAGAVLARGLARSRELAVRLSLGASRGHLVRHLLIESTMLALPASAIAILLVRGGLRALQQMDQMVPRLDEVQVDPRVLLSTIALAVLVTFAAGVLPALALSARDLSSRLRAHGAAGNLREHRPLWNGFIALQVALTLVLLTGTGLLVRSLQQVMSQDLGYRLNDLIAIDVSLPDTRYTDFNRRIAYYSDALERIRRVPGVTAAGLSNRLPDETTSWTASTASTANKDKEVYAGMRLVDAGYFQALGLKPLNGETLDPSAVQPTRAVIDERLAKQLWPGGKAIGGQVTNGFANEALTVVGTVSSLREWNATVSPGAIYVDYRTKPDRILDMHFVVQPATTAIERAVRAQLQAVDPMVPVAIEPLSKRIARTYGERSLMLIVASGFTVVTLLLAALGVYTIVAYSVGRELKNIAIRLILGARPAGVLRVLLSHGLRPVALGLACGLLATVPAVAALRSQLFGIQPFDPPVVLLGLVVLAGVAFIAAYLPARNVVRVDPNSVLRSD